MVFWFRRHNLAMSCAFSSPPLDFFYLKLLVSRNKMFGFNFHRIHFSRAHFFNRSPYLVCSKISISYGMPCQIFSNSYHVFQIERYFEVFFAHFFHSAASHPPHSLELSRALQKFLCMHQTFLLGERANTWWILKMCTDVMHVIQFHESHSKSEF